MREKYIKVTDQKIIKPALKEDQQYVTVLQMSWFSYVLFTTNLFVILQEQEKLSCSIEL
jgi:hypothetical protein